MDNRKEKILEALQAFVAQKPGLEFGNYGDVSAYRSEMRSITKDRHQAEELLRAVSWRDSITADDLIEASKHAYSGRLTIKDNSAHYADGSIYYVFGIDYCTGQYFPTEYRRAVCAVLAQAIWNYTREHAMPTASHAPEGTPEWSDGPLYDGVNAGTWLRRNFRREFGRTMQQRWFD